MPKWLWKTILFLLLGAVVNVALAWGCVCWHGDVTDGGWIYRCEKDGRRGLIELRTKAGYEYVRNLGGRGFHSYVRTFPIFDGLKWWPGPPGAPGDYSAHLACGWPELSLGMSMSRDIEIASAAGQTESIIFTGGVVCEPDNLATLKPGTIPMMLPYRPLWGGFAANTLLFASVLAIVVFGPGMLRRTDRREQGLCESCGYPRGNSEVCAECGARLRSTRPRAAVRL